MIILYSGTDIPKGEDKGGNNREMGEVYNRFLLGEALILALALIVEGSLTVYALLMAFAEGKVLEVVIAVAIVGTWYSALYLLMRRWIK